MNLKDHLQKKSNNTTERRLKVDRFSIKENLDRNEFKLLWVDGEQNIDDGFTKCAPQAQAVLEKALRSGRLPVKTAFA